MDESLSRFMVSISKRVTQRRSALSMYFPPDVDNNVRWTIFRMNGREEHSTRKEKE